MLTALKTAPVHSRYLLGTIAYMAALFTASAMPSDPEQAAVRPLRELLSNLLHVPAYAGLAWLVLMTLSGGRWKEPGSWPLYGLVVAVSVGYAALDEWHQHFVPGRRADLNDLALDSAGVALLLLAHRAMHKGETPDASSSRVRHG